MMKKNEIKDVIHTFAHKTIELPIEEEYPLQRELNLIGEEQLVPVLIECLDDQADEVRRLAMSLLCELKDKAESALSKMIGALSDHCKIVRLNAANGVAGFGQKAIAAVPIFETWIERKDRFEYVTAIQSILRIDPSKIDNLLPLLVEVLGMEECFARSHAVWVVRNLGENAKEAIPALNKLLHDDDLSERLDAAEAIQKITGDSSHEIKASIDLLNDESDWLNRLCGAEHLRNMGSKAHSAVPKLRLVLENDEHEAVRNEAERALGVIEGSNSSDEKMPL